MQRQRINTMVKSKDFSISSRDSFERWKKWVWRLALWIKGALRMDLKVSPPNLCLVTSRAGIVHSSSWHMQWKERPTKQSVTFGTCLLWRGAASFVANSVLKTSLLIFQLGIHRVRQKCPVLNILFEEHFSYGIEILGCSEIGFVLLKLLSPKWRKKYNNEE